MRTSFSKGFPDIGASFDPSTIPRYSVIRAPLPYYAGDPDPKYLIAIGHHTHKGVAFLVVLKATSHTSYYRDNPEAARGAIFYPAHTIPCLGQDTYVQPDNQFFIDYSDLQNHGCVVGALPPCFHQRLLVALANSSTLSPKACRAILSYIGESEANLPDPSG